MKIITALVATGMLLSSLSERQVLAQQSHTGIVENLHLNAGIATRGPCFHMQPSIPGINDNWACIWKDNVLYKEITLVLFSAWAHAFSCSIQWDQKDSSGFPKVRLLDCSHPPATPPGPPPPPPIPRNP